MDNHMEPTDMIRLWHATSSSSTPGAIEQCCEQWLDTDERERASRFRVATSRNQNIVGRGMARRVLSFDRIDPRRIRFELEAHGKPVVVEPDDAKLPFNVAHTDGLVLCGVGSPIHDRVGVDVEKLDRRTDPELAERYFSSPEVDHLRRLSCEQERRAAFLRIWTLKESFIKAMGTGLHTPLCDFAFEEIDSATPRLRLLSSKLNVGLDWHFFCIEPRPGYIGALAVGCHDRPASIRYSLESFDDLVGGKFSLADRVESPNAGGRLCR
jgi:4'-phosphopantetheinyl transferase